jgi:hypothetical protein
VPRLLPKATLTLKPVWRARLKTHSSDQGNTAGAGFRGCQATRPHESVKLDKGKKRLKYAELYRQEHSSWWSLHALDPSRRRRQNTAMIIMLSLSRCGRPGATCLPVGDTLQKFAVLAIIPWAIFTMTCSLSGAGKGHCQAVTDSGSP